MIIIAGNIKGITIELDGSTKKLQDAIKDVTSKSVELSKELKQVEKGLKFDPNNLTLIAQKQQILTEQIQATSEKLKVLKDAQSQVQAQFEKGEIGAEQYRAFQRELVATENALNGLKNKLSSIAQEQDKVQSSTKQLNTLFEATGKSVDDFANLLGNKLTNAIKHGTATSRQLEEAINKIGKEALGTNVDLDKMKQALASLDNGANIKKVQKELNSLAKEANEAQDEVKGLGNELAALAGGAVAGIGIGTAIEKALDLSSLDTKIEFTFEVPPESIASIKNAINTINSYGVDAESALEGVRRQWALNKNASDEVNQAVVEGAGAIASAYSGLDFTELIQEINEISSSLEISDQEAVALTNSLLKMGFPPEQIDIIAEYGLQLKEAGFNAQEIQAIMAAGVDTGTWNIDNLLDKILSL